MADRYAVIGHPVAHSRSPDIHKAFARQTGHDIDYERIDCAADAVQQTVERFFATGGKGLNVTAPHKQAAYLLADRVGARARVAGAANVLIRETDDRLTADNTDGTGLVRDLLQNLAVPLAGARVLILGAGGAVRGIVVPLLEQKTATLTIANRTHANAVELAESYSGFGQLSACPPDGLTGAFDLVIHATAAGPGATAPDIDPATIKDAVCYDLAYAPDGKTPFVVWAGHNGARAAHDGWGMLVEQAAESFYLWRGDWPQTGPLIASRLF